ncbi:MAG: type II secretion system protein GspL [Gammaproteobacteria bacterium]|nr:type II secretion system protein GspL [Gammaproteobacteria bacterium]
MDKQIHLRLLPNPADDSNPIVYWVTLQSGRAISGIKQSDLATAILEIGADNVIAYIPGIDILLTRVTLPAGRKSQLRNALPFALEENLIDDVENLHCALGPQLADGHYIAAVTRDANIQYWHQLLISAGLHLQALLPDTLLLPRTEGSWSIACEQNTAYIRTAEADGFVCHTNILPFLLQKELDNRGDNLPQSIEFHGCPAFNETHLSEASKNNVQLVHHPELNSGNFIELLLQNSPESSSLNLLQGEFAPSSRILQRIRPWYASAALAGVLLLLGFTGSVIEYISLKQQSAQLEQQILQTFRQAFPEVKSNVSPTTVSSIMKSRLAELRGKGRGSGPDFSEMLAKVAPVVAKAKGVNAQHLRYQSGQMEILLITPDLQTLEQLKNQISSAVPWEVELKSANSTGKKVEGRIAIFRKS